MRTLLIISLFITFVAFGQEEKKNEISNKGCNTQDKCYRLLRFGIGVQKSLYTELGVCKIKVNSFNVEDLRSDFYVAIDWTPTVKPEKEKNIYGLKSGIEYSIAGLAVGLEAKYHTDWNYNNFIITPKIGLGLQKFRIYYGYNIFTDKNNFSKVGHHQISLVFLFNKYSFFYSHWPRGQ